MSAASQCDPVVFHVLYLSTQHLTPEDKQRLQSQAIVSLATFACQGGWWLNPAAAKEDLIQQVGFSEAVLQIVRLAKTHDCEFVYVTPHGPVYEDLPVFPQSAESQWD